MLRVRSCTDTSAHKKPPCPAEKPAYPLQGVHVQRCHTSTRAKRVLCSPQPRFRTKATESPFNLRLNSTLRDFSRPITVKTRKKELHCLKPKPNSEVKLSRIRSFLLVTLGGTSSVAPRYPGPLTPTRSYQFTTNQSLSGTGRAAVTQLSLLSDVPSVRQRLRLQPKPLQGLRVNTDPEGISAWEAETEGRPSSNFR